MTGPLIKKARADPTVVEEVAAIPEAFTKISEAISVLEGQYEAEADALDTKYTDLKRPIMIKRNALTNEMADFWPTAFMNHGRLFQDLVPEMDFEIVQSIRSLDVSKDDGFFLKMQIEFDENSHMEKTSFIKTYKELDGDMEVIASDIKWKISAKPCCESEDSKGKKRAHDHVDAGNSFFKLLESTTAFDTLVTELYSQAIRFHFGLPVSDDEGDFEGQFGFDEESAEDEEDEEEEDEQE